MNCQKCDAPLGLIESLFNLDCAACKRRRVLERERQRDEHEQLRQAGEARAARIAHGLEAAYPDGCPSCGGELLPIHLFSVAQRKLKGDLHYSKKKKSWFWGYPSHGRIQAGLCSECQRVCLHGVPR